MTTPTTPTAQLPPTAAVALSRLERAFLPLDVVRAVTRYEVASARFDELIARPVASLSPAEFEAFGQAQQTIAETLGVLADAGRLDLTGPAETATRYRQAAAHCQRFAAVGDYDGCLPMQDEMRLCHCQLERAGRLDLIGAGP